jgi:hypothetical protein
MAQKLRNMILNVFFYHPMKHQVTWRVHNRVMKKSVNLRDILQVAAVVCRPELCDFL